MLLVDRLSLLQQPSHDEDETQRRFDWETMEKATRISLAKSVERCNPPISWTATPLAIFCSTAPVPHALHVRSPHVPTDGEAVRSASCSASMVSSTCLRSSADPAYGGHGCPARGRTSEFRAQHRSRSRSARNGPGCLVPAKELRSWRGHLTTTHEDRGLEAGSTTQISGERSVGINTWSTSSSCAGCTVWTGMQGADCWFSFRWSGLYARATRSRTLQRSKGEIAKSREWRVAC